MSEAAGWVGTQAPVGPSLLRSILHPCPYGRPQTGQGRSGWPGWGWKGYNLENRVNKQALGERGCPLLALQIGLCLRRQPGPVPIQTVRCCGGLKMAKLPSPHGPTPIFKAAGKRGGGGRCPAWPQDSPPGSAQQSRLVGDFGQGAPSGVLKVQRSLLFRRLARVGEDLSWWLSPGARCTLHFSVAGGGARAGSRRVTFSVTRESACSWETN